MRLTLNSADSVAELEFVRGRDRQEGDGNTLFISEANGNSAAVNNHGLI